MLKKEDIKARDLGLRGDDIPENRSYGVVKASVHVEQSATYENPPNSKFELVESVKAYTRATVWGNIYEDIAVDLRAIKKEVAHIPCSDSMALLEVFKRIDDLIGRVTWKRS